MGVVRWAIVTVKLVGASMRAAVSLELVDQLAGRLRLEAVNLKVARVVIDSAESFPHKVQDVAKVDVESHGK